MIINVYYIIYFLNNIIYFGEVFKRIYYFKYHKIINNNTVAMDTRRLTYSVSSSSEN